MNGPPKLRGDYLSLYSILKQASKNHCILYYTEGLRYQNFTLVVTKEQLSEILVWITERLCSGISMSVNDLDR